MFILVDNISICERYGVASNTMFNIKLTNFSLKF